MSENVRQQLENAGWKLARDDQPGIYVRAETVPANDVIDWVSKPFAMLEDLERVRGRRERNIRRKQNKKRHRVVGAG